MNSNEKEVKWDISVYQFTQDEPFRNTFWQVKEANIHNIILDVRKENLYSALKQVSYIPLIYTYICIYIDMYNK